MDKVTVGELMSTLADTQLTVISGGSSGLDQPIGQAKVQRVGIALTGFVQNIESNRIQLMGRTEVGYLDTLPTVERVALLEALFAVGFPALVISAGLQPSEQLKSLADECGVALITTTLESTAVIDRLNNAMFGWLAPREVRHAVLVDVHGVGILLVGKSGIGKSEIGLELITRGHRLVADDLVILEKTSATSVVGHSPELTRHHMEIRGLGIINIRDLYGAAAVRERKRVELVVELVEWSEMPSVDRLGLDKREMSFADVSVQHVTLPVRPGRSLTLIIEVAARNRLLQIQGTHSAAAFAERLDTQISQAHNPMTEPPLSIGGDDDE
jgi:HPr kinase/phosphorylase